MKGRRAGGAPDGYAITWGGQFENQQRAAARLCIVVPLLSGELSGRGIVYRIVPIVESGTI